MVGGKTGERDAHVSFDFWINSAYDSANVGAGSDASRILVTGGGMEPKNTPGISPRVPGLQMAQCWR